MLCMHQSARREDEYSTENFTPINANSFVSRHQVLYHQSAMFLIYCNFIVKLQYLLLPGQNLSNETSELQERQISLLHTCIIIQMITINLSCVLLQSESLHSHFTLLHIFIYNSYIKSNHNEFFSICSVLSSNHAIAKIFVVIELSTQDCDRFK